MIENNNIENQEVAVENIKKEAKGLFEKIFHFISELLDIRKETDREQTIEDIKNGIAFKGHTAWILIFAVFIASIGLNVSSTAVVIGAMLISPLMGPILGIGMSLAIYDMDTLKRSVISLAIMVGLSVFTAWLYFEVSPLTEETPELLARTSPTILDVLIAIFGGLALIVAKSKKGTMGSVIFGVAIATALMPPLCTVGYGLATRDATFYVGGMYLFTINTIFIALATFVVTKILAFPLVKYANVAKRNKIKWSVTAIAILTIIPAAFTFVSVLEKSNEKKDIRNFVKQEIKSNEALFLNNFEADHDNKILSLSFLDEVSDATISDLENEKKTNYPYLKNFTLKIKGNKIKSFDLISSAYQDAQKRLDEKDNIIKGLQGSIDNLKQQLVIKNGTVPLDFLKISKDAKINFYDLKSIAFTEELRSNFKTIDTLPTVIAKWKTETTDSILHKRKNELQKWLQNEMKLDTLYLR